MKMVEWGQEQEQWGTRNYDAQQNQILPSGLKTGATISVARMGNVNSIQSDWWIMGR
jgi:hypothetical protein